MVELDVVEDVAVDDEQVAPAVVIEIEEARAECAVENAGLADAGGDGVVGEGAVAIVAVEAVELEIKMADEKVGQAVVGDVGGVGAHAGFGAAVFAEASAGSEAGVAKGAVAIVEVEEVALRVVGDEDVGPAVIV